MIKEIQVTKYQDENGNIYDTIEEAITAKIHIDFNTWYEAKTIDNKLYDSYEPIPSDKVFAWFWHNRIFLNILLDTEEQLTPDMETAK